MFTTKQALFRKHIHTFVRYKNNQYKRKDLYRCNDPYCNYVHEVSFLEGKASLCTKCGAEFILTKEDLKRSRPRCINCSNTQAARAKRRITSMIDNVPGLAEIGEEIK